MEIPFSKVLTTLLIASLGLALVTMSVKRRQPGGRVIRHNSLEILRNQCADKVFVLEGNTAILRFGEHIAGTAGS